MLWSVPASKVCNLFDFKLHFVALNSTVVKVLYRKSYEAKLASAFTSWCRNCSRTSFHWKDTLGVGRCGCNWIYAIVCLNEQSASHSEPYFRAKNMFHSWRTFAVILPRVSGRWWWLVAMATMTKPIKCWKWSLWEKRPFPKRNLWIFLSVLIQQIFLLMANTRYLHKFCLLLLFSVVRPPKVSPLWCRNCARNADCKFIIHIAKCKRTTKQVAIEIIFAWKSTKKK